MADAIHAARMTGAQYAEEVRRAVAAEVAAKRRAGLRLPADAWRELREEVTSAVALAGLERARAIDDATGHPYAGSDGYCPRWAGVYAEQHAPASAAAEWSELHRGERAQLCADRWHAFLRNAAKRELATRAADAGSRAELPDDAPDPHASRHAAAVASVDALAAHLAAAGRPIGALERHALAAHLDGLTHAQRAEVLGSTADACKTYAAKGRKLLRKRWPHADAAWSDLDAARRAGNRVDLGRAAQLASCAPETMARLERFAARRGAVAEVLPNVERADSGHAGGCVRTIAHEEERAASRVESAAKQRHSVAIHRAGTGPMADRYAGMLAAAHAAADAATRHAMAGEVLRACLERHNVRCILAAAPGR